MNAPLAGCRVLHTRADHHWPQARAHLQALGAIASHLPLLDTRALPFALPEALDAAVFTSANAVTHFFAQSALPCAAIAIGEKTREALVRHDHPPAMTAPPPYDSEALLAVWQAQGLNIAIIAAPGGRSHLHDTLSQMNRVHMVYAYERFCPSASANLAEAPDAILIGSCRTLDFLGKIAEPNTLKLLQCRTCVVAMSPRIADYATQHGFRHVISANRADEDAQFHALCHWWALQQGVMR
ncbi:MAG: uroporphyrinogen-III synthase [Cardiobacteriaceae bacterium]|nr:uroporphyrinogen-III synthase [Cardiobacteriaceae bacterium]